VLAAVRVEIAQLELRVCVPSPRFTVLPHGSRSDPHGHIVRKLQ
jgi:hypothetical protein